MHFEAEHRFDGSIDQVVAVLGNPTFYLTLHLPDVDLPELVSHDTPPDRSMIRLRYTFAGQLDPMAQRLVGAQQLVWIQEVDVQQSTGKGDLHFEAERSPERLHGDAEFSLVQDGAGTVRHIAGELVVAVPMLGSTIERKLVPGVLKRLDVEAAAVNTILTHPQNG